MVEAHNMLNLDEALNCQHSIRLIVDYSHFNTERDALSHTAFGFAHAYTLQKIAVTLGVGLFPPEKLVNKK